ncbi:MAG: hypothetical protein HY246_13325 [Proteobacteria bacterium]|nr:hypothetical protein [Pseudomonadota bacterium]
MSEPATITLSYYWVCWAAWAGAGFVVPVALLYWRLSGRMLALGALLMTAFLSTAAQEATWSARLTAREIAVSAPLSWKYESGAIAWSDVTAVAIVRSGMRFPSYSLHVVARTGRDVTLPLLDLPREAIPRLVEIVLTRSRAAAEGTAAVRSQLTSVNLRASDWPAIVADGL